MLSTLVLNVTYRCPIACDYCGLGCNPDRTERMTVAEMLDAVEYAASLGTIRHVTFTGGEPLLHSHDVEDVLTQTTALDWTSRIVTNAFWAKTPAKARQLLAPLAEAGLTEMNLSVDDMHQAHIPLANIRYAHDACVELGVRVLLAHRTFEGCQITVERLEALFGRRLSCFEEERERAMADQTRSVPPSHVYSTSTYVPAGPRGHTLDERRLAFNPFAHRMRCDSVLKDLIVSPGKHLDICCGVTNHRIPELKYEYASAGSIGEALLRMNRDLVANWLVLEGPCGIAEYVQQRAPGVRFDKCYVNNCHLCRDVLSHPVARQVLREVDTHKLLQLYFLRQVYDARRSDPELTATMFELPNLASLKGRIATGESTLGLRA